VCIGALSLKLVLGIYHIVDEKTTKEAQWDDTNYVGAEPVGSRRYPQSDQVLAELRALCMVLESMSLNLR
jgi:hypothetical protein